MDEEPVRRYLNIDGIRYLPKPGPVPPLEHPLRLVPLDQPPPRYFGGSEDGHEMMGMPLRAAQTGNDVIAQVMPGGTVEMRPGVMTPPERLPIRVDRYEMESRILSVSDRITVILEAAKRRDLWLLESVVGFLFVIVLLYLFH